MERIAIKWPLALSLVLVVVTGTVAMADTPFPDFRAYKIFRNGSEVGNRDLKITRQGEDTVVELTTSIKVKVAFITVFRRDEYQREVWRDGQLISFTSKVDDDGEDFTVEAVRNGSALDVTGLEGGYAAPPGTLPATYWTRAIVDAPTLIQVKLGNLQHVLTAFVGEETVELGTGRVAASRYKMTGDENLDLWFDATGTAARVIYHPDDGSELEFVLSESR